MPEIVLLPTPIIGAAYKLINYVAVVTLECNQCDGHHVMTLVGNAVLPCPQCGSTYTVMGVQFIDPRSGQPGASPSAGIVIGFSKPTAKLSSN